jgi:hypothetical protein
VVLARAHLLPQPAEPCRAVRRRRGLRAHRHAGVQLIRASCSASLLPTGHVLWSTSPELDRSVDRDAWGCVAPPAS